MLEEDASKRYHLYQAEEMLTELNNDDHYRLSTLSFIISAALVLPALILAANTLSRICNNKIRLYTYHQAIYIWILVACFLCSILDILNLFVNILNKNKRMKSARSCYYVYVFESTLISSIAVSLCSMVVDIVFNILMLGRTCFYNHGKAKLLPVMFFVFVIVCFIFNNLQDICNPIKETYVITCWKGSAYGYQSSVVGKLDLSIQILLIFAMVLLCVLTIVLLRKKIRLNRMVITPDFIIDAYIVNSDDEAVAETIQQNTDIDKESSQSQSSDNEDGKEEAGRKKSSPNAERMTRNDSVKVVNEENKGKRGSKKLFRCSSHKIRRDRIHPDKNSSESSGQTNSGYMSDSNEETMEVKVNLTKTKSLASAVTQEETTFAYDGRKRIKSDSDLQKSKRKAFKKNLEEHVFYALENFFTVEPSRLVSLPKIVFQKGELNQNLITDDEDEIDDVPDNEKDIDSDENKDDEDVTSFMEGGPRYVPLEVEFDESDELDGETFKIEEVTCNTGTKSVEMKELGKESKGISEDSESRATDADRTSNSFCELSGGKCSPIFYADGEAEDEQLTYKQDEISQNASVNEFNAELQKIGSDSSIDNIDELNTETEINSTKISVDVDVHSLQPSLAEDNDVFVAQNISVDKSNSPAKGRKTSFRRSHSNKSDKQVRWDNQILDEIAVDIETKIGVSKAENAVEGVEEMNDGLDNRDDKINEPNEGAKGEINDTKNINMVYRDDQIACEETNVGDGPSVRVKRKEVLPFSEYSQRYIIKPFKDVMYLMLTYIICMVPQMVLDLYRISNSDQLMMDHTDGLLSIFSDVALSMFLLVISVVALWRSQKATKLAEQRHWWLEV